MGYPLPFYTLSAIDLYKKQNPSIECEIVLNTDSQELITLFKSVHTLKVESIVRESDLALDHTPKISVISKSLEIMEMRKNTSYDMVVDMDITSPLRTTQDVQSLIIKKCNSNADVIFSVTDARRNPFFNMVKKTDGGCTRVIESSFSTRQEAPVLYDMNASLYAYSPHFLKSGKGIFEGSCDYIKMRDTAVLDIDSEQDFELMQVIAKFFFEKSIELNEIRDHIEKLTSQME